LPDSNLASLEARSVLNPCPFSLSSASTAFNISASVKFLLFA
jgi:hypothetical protein